jgi:hypothetical protein
VARMASAVGKTYDKIWADFKATYPELPEADLKRIHDKWRWLSSTT